MDILSGKSMNAKPMPYSPNQLVEIWEKISRLIPPLDNQIQTSHMFHSAIKDLMKSRGARFLSQFHYCHTRSIIQQFRGYQSFFLELFVASLAGSLMGLSFMNYSELFQGVWIAPYAFLSPTPSIAQVSTQGFLVGTAIALAAAPAGVKIYGEEKVVFWREASSGHNRLAYYLGKMMASLPRMSIAALHFASFFHMVSRPIISFESQYSMIVLQYFGVYGLSTILSMGKSLCANIEFSGSP
jgi:hypothetical protein